MFLSVLWRVFVPRRVALVRNYSLANYSLLLIGLSGVWVTTHSGWAIFWTMVASLHVCRTLIPTLPIMRELIPNYYKGTDYYMKGE